MMQPSVAARLRRLAGLLIAVAGPALAPSIGPAGAADLGPPPIPGTFVAEPQFRLLDEVRAGILAHDVAHKEQGSVDAAFELLSSRLPVHTGSVFADFLLGPRLHLGTTVNLEGKTSHVFAGVTWTAHLTERFFVEGAFGGALHNGEQRARPGRTGLGDCAVTFREWGGVGVAFSPQWSLIAGVEHLSHAGLCGRVNDGLTNVGAKLGYKF